ncbi:helix-turn-helix domain-containing protein [Saccharothrix sp. S26]|uniref:PucR family transcriptional regulator n=1 Tax=Saccharothrix sp. S26 TaxID=2907215 RepID=UPI001F2AB8B1|nr:helix-turn-helix domain-containing protein [Saccharothrix sp. S26]MCE6993587.1 helix-turn-helix domain-containing protein [Saccharothrix sp. S26]
MRGLLRKLSALDADAETAIRVIAYFDTLVESRATVVEVVRATAGLADGVVGVELDGRPPVRLGPDGKPASRPVAVTAQAAVGTSGRVWLERPDGPRPLDDLVLERCAITLRVLEPPRHTPHLADPALVELVLSEREAPEDRARAVKLLGLAHDRPLRIAAVRCGPGQDPGAEAVRLVARAGRHAPVRVGIVGRHAALVLQPPDAREWALPRGEVRLGLGGTVDGLRAHTSWKQAQQALRFTSAEHPVVDFTDLGATALLAEVPVEMLRRDADVAALTALAATPSGRLDVAALEAFCVSGSLRKAAESLHLHHSSVASRLARAEDVLGWSLDTPHGRFRTMVALLARRLAG